MTREGQSAGLSAGHMVGHMVSAEGPAVETRVIIDPETLDAARTLLTLKRDPQTMQYKWKNDHRKAAGNAL